MAICRSCDLPTTGKSSYCRTHAMEARAAWKARISEESEAREARKAQHNVLWAKACAAACEAWRNAVPAPMVVTDDSSGQQWHVSEGLCGFATLVVRPGNSSFAHWLKANVRTYKNYSGGIAVSSSSIVPEDARSQSYDRKSAAVRAAVAVLRDAGIKATADTRLD